MFLLAAVVAISPPDAGFYAKKVEYRGIPIKASAAVSDEALEAARRCLEKMLSRLPNVAENMADAGVELHLIGKGQVTSDLPEHRHLKSKPFDGEMNVDERTRGLGGRLASCGEENLLKLPGDRYAGRDICVHEFAHTLREFGLPAKAVKAVRRRYHLSLAEGLWETQYAGTNDNEFFAEISMWYFGTHGDPGKLDPPPGDGKTWLKAYDPGALKIMEDVYACRYPVARQTWVVLAPHPVSEEGSLKSLTGDKPTEVRLVNATGATVDVFWLDYEGKRSKKYASLEPGESFHNRTYATHAWVLADPTGRALALYVAQTQPGSAVVHGAGEARR